jgi:hypothetical protein
MDARLESLIQVTNSVSGEKQNAAEVFEDSEKD